MSRFKNQIPLIGPRGFVSLVTILLCLASCSGDDNSLVAPAATEDPGNVSLDRQAWSLASVSVDPDAGGPLERTFLAQDRVETIRWFTPSSPVLRRYLEPDLGGAAGEAQLPALELYLRAETGAWGPSNWGGIMCSPPVTGTGFPDLSAMAWLDIWVNDWTADPSQRSGRLHVDYGRLDEDGFWPLDGEGHLVTGQFDQEDGISFGVPDGVFVAPEEDIGLDRCGDQTCWYSPEYEVSGDAPYPNINKTGRNNREDTEDIDHNGQWDRSNSYFTCVLDLAVTEPLVDVVRDYDAVEDLVAAGLAWRLYRIPIRRSVTAVADTGTPDLADVRHLRIWLEDYGQSESAVRSVQLAEIRFH